VLFTIFLGLKLLVLLRAFLYLSKNMFLIFYLRLVSWVHDLLILLWTTIKLNGEQGALFTNKVWYHQLVGKLIYLTMTCPKITHVVGVVSQYMHAPRQPHFDVYRILRI
jgi:hypothetical protein